MGEVLKSERTNERAFVRFFNWTERTVEIIWISFTGSYERYQILEKGRFVDINTYRKHPWIAIDHMTKDRLHIEKSFVYYPKTTREYLQTRRPDKRIPDNFETRIRVGITLPVYSLRYGCMLLLRNFFNSPEEIDDLNLPKELICDLKRVITQRNNHQLRM